MIDRSLSNYPKGNDLVSAKCNSQNQLELKKFGTQAKFRFVNFFFFWKFIFKKFDLILVGIPWINSIQALDHKGACV